MAEIQHARRKTAYGDSEVVGISSQSKLFLKYECIPLILQQSNSLKSDFLINEFFFYESD